MDNASNSQLKGLAQSMATKLNEKDEIAGEIKELRDEVKQLGFNTKAFNQIVKEMRKGAKYQADQLELELELTTYRRESGLPTDLAVAQERAREEAERVPSTEGKGKQKGMH